LAIAVGPIITLIARAFLTLGLLGLILIARIIALGLVIALIARAIFALGLLGLTIALDTLILILGACSLADGLEGDIFISVLVTWSIVSRLIALTTRTLSTIGDKRRRCLLVILLPHTISDNQERAY
jgi:hypothetical protein